MQVLDSHSFANELHLLLRNRSRLRAALGEDAIDLRAILGKFSAVLTHRCNHFFEIFRQEFFGLLVADAALAIAAFELAELVVAYQTVKESGSLGSSTPLESVVMPRARRSISSSSAKSGMVLL